MNVFGKGRWVVTLGLALLAAPGCGDDKKSSTPESPSGGSKDQPNNEAGQPTSNAGVGATSSGGDTSTGATNAIGGADGGAPEGSAGAPEAADPCQGVTTRGECVSPSSLQRCVVPTGNGSPMLVAEQCRDFEHCDDSGRQVRCVLDNNACVPAQAECVNAKQLRTCDAKGVWHTESCPGACQASAIGGFCTSGAATTTFNGTLLYKAVPVLDTYVDWSKTTVDEPAEGVLVLSGNKDEWLDAALVDENGAFSLQVPVSNTGFEQLAFFLIHPDPTGAFAQFGVFDPNVPDGVVSTQAQLDGQTWSWAAPLSDLSSGGTITITEQQGSGAIHLYRRLLQVQRFDTDFYKATPGTIAAWFHLNTAWDCGACFAPFPTEVASSPFDSQLFISATAQDRAYWSDAVTIHEAGHYTMWSYGVSPNEGGEHCLGLPTSPGQAWSEGWATGFSSILRESSVYWDKQQGSMFWFDVGERHYEEVAWQRPKASRGLLQDIDENEVAAMLWSLASDANVGPDNTLLGLRTANVTGTDFARGYTRHVWDMNNCRRLSYFDTGESAPMFADYLDGLVCGGVPATAIDDTTNPGASYPYPSKQPLCAGPPAPLPRVAAPALPNASLRAAAQPPELGPHQSPVTVTLRGPDRVSAAQDVEIFAEVEQRAGSAEVRLELQLPEGVRLVSGEDAEVLPSGNGRLLRRFVVHVDRVPVTDIQAVASTQSKAFGARAEGAYRFGRPEPRFAQLLRSARALKVGGKDVGRPIQLR